MVRILSMYEANQRVFENRKQCPKCKRLLTYDNNDVVDGKIICPECGREIKLSANYGGGDPYAVDYPPSYADPYAYLR